MFYNLSILLGILCKLIAPPPQVSAIHQQIIRSLKDRLTSEGCHLTEDDSGPAVVIAVNSSGLVADVKRDLGKTGKYRI